MKIQLLFLLFLGLNGFTFGQDFKSPADYLSFIQNEKTNISKSTWKYTSATALKNWRKMNETQKQLIKDIQSAKKKISKLKNGYNGDVAYRDQILLYLDFFEKSLNEEYEKIINIPDVIEQSNDTMDILMQVDNLVNSKLDSENEKMDIAYKSFAQKHNIELYPESEWSKKVKIYNEICNYHAVLNMIYFKVTFTDGNLSAAIRNADIGAIQQNANALIQYADEGLAQLKNIEPYNGDYSVINAANKVLEFYKKEAEQYIPQLISFLMFNDKLENAKKTIESKSESDKTPEEENNYKSMVEQMQTEITTIKKIKSKNYFDKKDVLIHWISIGEDFITRHIPKD